MDIHEPHNEPHSPGGRRILLGVTGGIAAYKSVELVRRLRERGADVQVVMTAAAQEFVTATTFQAVSGRSVRTSLWDAAAEAAMSHIELSRWADTILIAPASADTIARLAHGFASDLLSTVVLATRASVWLAPAMNPVMWDQAVTRANVALLRERGCRILGPGSGAQACGETGPGRMLEPGEIAAAVLAPATAAGELQGVHVLLTAGPTREPIDPVRYMTNRSSGKMGFALAEAFLAAGARVTLVAGPVSLATPVGARRIDVETAAEMHTAVMQDIAAADIFVGCAAVADYHPTQAAADKLKRHDEQVQLTLQRSADILADVAARPSPPFTVGFAAETRALEEHALGKLRDKRIDLIAANRVGAGVGFDVDANALNVYWRDGSVVFAQASKREIAARLVNLIALRYRAPQELLTSEAAG